jgi:acyl-CoA dehydrogenase
VYGQLILEQAKIVDLDVDVVDTIFEVLVRDFSAACVAMHGKAGANQAQREGAVSAVTAPVTSDERFGKVWAEVADLSGAYAMKP